MEEKNCEILFEYLRDIIYDSENAKLDLEQLDEPFWKLGKGLQYLDKAVKEVKHYSAEISKGNLSIEAPGRDNFLCENLKNIHANLNHLTWQAKQVAKGDYSQSVSYLGEFSESFNTMTKQLKEIFKVEEIRVYFGIILGAGTFIALNIRSLYGSLGEAFRHAFFQVGSIITTCGYATTDFDLWPETSKMILVLLMFIGACAGSTGGGFKISRLLILCKAIPKQLSLVIHPREVKVIRMDGKPIDHNTLRSTNVYLAIYFFILLVSTLLISVDNFNLTTNFTAVASTLNNIGPGLDGVGPTRNFGMYSDFSKFVLMFDMLAGRLELYPLLILFMPSLWRRK